MWGPPILGRSLSGLLFKLPHKVYFAVVSAGVRNLVHRKSGGGQEITGVFRPGTDQVCNDTGAVELPVDMLEGGTAKPCFLCQFLRGMVQIRLIIHLASDTVKHKKVGVAMADGLKFFTQVIKKKAKIQG